MNVGFAIAGKDIWRAIALAIIWAVFFAYWPVSLLLSFVWMRGAPASRAKRAFLLPFLVVPVLSFAWGAGTWVTGSAVLLQVGLMPPDTTDLYGGGRVRRVSTGCIVNGSEMFTHNPNNAAVMALSAMFGPMPGTAYARDPSPNSDERG